MSLGIFYDETGYRYRGWRKVQNLLRDIIRKEQKFPGDINIIVTGDEKLRKINAEFLEHDYNTDVQNFN